MANTKPVARKPYNGPPRLPRQVDHAWDRPDFEKRQKERDKLWHAWDMKERKRLRDEARQKKKLEDQKNKTKTTKKIIPKKKQNTLAKKPITTMARTKQTSRKGPSKEAKELIEAESDAVIDSPQPSLPEPKKKNVAKRSPRGKLPMHPKIDLESVKIPKKSPSKQQTALEPPTPKTNLNPMLN